MFVNTLSTAGRYPVHYCGNLQLPIQMQLSEKPKMFSAFFIPFLKSTSNFKHLEKKDDSLSSGVFEITDCEKLRHTTL